MKTGGIMHFSEYIEYDAVGLAHLIKSGAAIGYGG